MGKVFLIGVGPGDQELITLKAVRALEKCTAILYDRLVNKAILRHLKEDCQIYYCGKEPDCHYQSQDEINDMLAELAQAGHIVGRIKGGDPFVFGRGGEEALRLYEEGISFEVIPGISSAISVLNYAGIPVTHRKMARSFHVFTGKSAENLELDWRTVAKLEGTLVFLMGLANLENITGNLVANGMDPRVPCAVIMNGTTAKQQKIVGPLGKIAELVRDAGFRPPSIIVVGEVVKFNEFFNWYERKPLFGLNICVVRSKEQTKGIRERLIDLGAGLTEINTIKIQDYSHRLDDYIGYLSQYDYIVLTSVNGAKLFFNRLKKLEYDLRKISAFFAAIGPATADAIKEKGIIPELVADSFVAEGLFDKMKGHLHPGDKILLPRSKKARPYLCDALRDSGCIVDEIHLYEVRPGDMLPEEGLRGVDIILFTSPSTVRNMIAMTGIEAVKNKRCIAIGPITQQELRDNGIRSEVCKLYTMQGMIDQLLETTEKHCY